MARVLVLMSMLLILFIAASPARSLERTVTAYVPEYRLSHVINHAAKILPRVTDLILFSVEVDHTGHLKELSRFFPTRKALKRENRQNVRLSLCVGGGGRSAGFSKVVSSKTAMKNFVDELFSMLGKHDLDGADIDWEGSFEPKAYSTLLTKLRAAFDPRGYRLTVALHPWQKLTASGYAAVHGVHLMAYDLDPQRHSTLRQAKQAVGTQIQSEVKPTKILLGIPAYGRGIGDPGRVATFAELVAKHGAAVITGTDEVDGMYYNGPKTVRMKAKFAFEHLGGVFLWEAGQDTVDSQTSLLEVMAGARQNKGTSKRRKRKRKRKRQRRPQTQTEL